MGNTAYLCSSDYAGAYPSHELDSFDPKIHTIAAGAYTIPLTWLALFGADSLVAHTFHVPAEEWVEFGSDGKAKKVVEPAHEDQVLAPVADRELCLERLPLNIPALEEMLSIPAGTLAEHQALLLEAIEDHKGKFLTIEWDEIIVLGFDENESYAGLKAILRWFDGDRDRRGVVSWLKTIDLDTNRPIYSPRGFYKLEGLEKQDYRNLENLLGSGHFGKAPWER